MANLKQYKKGIPTNITAHFKSTEFDCNCNYSDCQWTIVDIDHILKLEFLRIKWGRPIKINSGYRCSRRNKEEGGATHSRHLVSDATDIVVQGMEPDHVAAECEEFFNGLGRYDSFTHIDSRPINPGRVKARWDFRKK